MLFPGKVTFNNGLNWCNFPSSVVQLQFKWSAEKQQLFVPKNSTILHRVPTGPAVRNFKYLWLLVKIHVLAKQLSLSAEVVYCKVTAGAQLRSSYNQMDFHHQKANLSFSIENILREDFSQRRTRNVPSIPSNQSSFERWPSTPVYRYCAVRYCPVFMHFVPTVQRVGARFHRVNAEKNLEFSDQPKRFKEDCLSCEDSEPRQDDGKHFKISLKYSLTHIIIKHWAKTFRVLRKRP